MLNEFWLLLDASSLRSTLKIYISQFRKAGVIAITIKKPREIDVMVNNDAIKDMANKMEIDLDMLEIDQLKIVDRLLR